MRTTMQVKNVLMAATITIAAISCKKDNSIDNVTDVTNETTSVNAQAIAVGTAEDGDSVYVVNACNKNQILDSVAFSSLPTAITTYLAADYAGYTSQKAYTVEDTLGTLNGYVVIIQYNGTPVGLKFDASGIFSKVLEQRERGDMNGRGYHRGGRFDDRDGLRRDTIALGSLPASISSYFAANYPLDTLVKALKNRDSSIVVLSVNNGQFATLFDVAGSFVKRVQLPSHRGWSGSIELTALPATAQSYLTTTYPNYVFKHAFKIVSGNTVEGYVVFIDANGTKYAVEFDAAGTFVKAVTVR
jgi:hypothetical protein